MASNRAVLCKFTVWPFSVPKTYVLNNSKPKHNIQEAHMLQQVRMKWSESPSVVRISYKFDMQRANNFDGQTALKGAHSQNMMVVQIKD